MPKIVLPDPLRIKIKEFFKGGMPTLEVYDSVYEESAPYVNSDKQLSLCIASLKGKARKELGEAHAPAVCSEPPPGPKPFCASSYCSVIDSLSQTTPNKDFERACLPIAADILIKNEGFSSLIDANEIEGFHNPPFDFFGFKNSRPYIVEFKGSLENFNTPGETQKRRMRELIESIEGLNVALLQVKLRKGVYRILYDSELGSLFDGREVPLGPVVVWIRNKIKDANT